MRADQPGSIRPWAAILAAAAALVCAGPSAAKDGRSLWYFGLAPGFHYTPDDARSNAALAGDIRPDRFEERDVDLQDGLTYGLTAGFGITSRFSLQLDAGYFKGDVGPADTYLADEFPVVNPLNPTNVARIEGRELSIPAAAGVLTEIPVSLSGIVRFRKDRPINPYLGAGVGMIFTELDRSEDIDELNERFGSLRIKAVSNEHGENLVPTRYDALRGIGKVPFTYPISVSTEDAFEWHLAAGLEYFFHDRVSLAAEARYMFAGTSVEIGMEGEDQIVIDAFAERLFREDGSLRFFNDRGSFPNPLVDPNDVSKGTVDCAPNTRADFDKDGHADDLCFSLGSFDEPPSGTFVVQGGRINLSGLTVQIGLRVWF